MFSCRNFTIQSEQFVIADFGFSIIPGSVLQIVSEKVMARTAILKALAQLNDSSTLKSGNVLYDKVLIDAKNRREYYNLICYIDNRNPLVEHFTVLENLQFWADLYGSKLNLDLAITSFDLMSYVSQKISSLNQSIQKAVVLSKLILSSRPLWLLDDPFACLEQQAKDALLNLINARCYQEGIVLITSSSKASDLPHSAYIDLETYISTSNKFK